MTHAHLLVFPKQVEPISTRRRSDRLVAFEAIGLGRHMIDCALVRSKWFVLSCHTERLRGFLAARIISALTSVVLVAVAASFIPALFARHT